MIIISIYVNEQHNSANIHEYLLQEKVKLKCTCVEHKILMFFYMIIAQTCFDIGHCVIQVKVTVGILNFLHLESRLSSLYSLHYFLNILL